MHTLIAFLEDIDPAGVMVPIAGVADPHVTVNGDDITVPSGLEQIVAAAGLVETTVAGRARLVSPTLRVRNNFEIAPLNGQAAGAQVPDTPHAIVDMRFNPLALAPGEKLNANILSNPAAAQDQSVLVWLADGPIQPVTGQIFTARATNGSTLVANSWTNGALTFDEDLAPGRYQIVGMRAQSAGLVAARLVIPGLAARPGVMGNTLVGNHAAPFFRYGGMGVFGEFQEASPPTVDFLSISADTAQVVYLDLIRL